MKYYYRVSDRFLAGEYPRNIDEASSQAKMDALIGLGVTAFIDLTGVPDEMKPYAHFFDNRDILYQNFPIRDVSVPASSGLTRKILDTIDEHIASGRVVYVHCWGGVGRTGVIVGCWLSRHGLPGRPALERLRELWRGNPKSAWKRSPETPEQEQYIIDWNEN
jgi:protein-tyrosine phosphatase